MSSLQNRRIGLIAQNSRVARLRPASAKQFVGQPDGPARKTCQSRKPRRFFPKLKAIDIGEANSGQKNASPNFTLEETTSEPIEIIPPTQENILYV
jgi:hypothetical protein